MPHLSMMIRDGGKNKIFRKVNCRPGDSTEPNKSKAEQPKDYGINTTPHTEAIIYSVSFWLGNGGN